VKGSCGTPGTPCLSYQPCSKIEEVGPSLVDCMAVVWWLYGGCMAVLKVEPWPRDRW
jgi:hypothetical protein